MQVWGCANYLSFPRKTILPSFCRGYVYQCWKRVLAGDSVVKAGQALVDLRCYDEELDLII